ncbi:MAG: hypothetical protein A2Y23_08570 [Clostridiales bacterium GWB2_37_7]|nr:MAG: hypothetical protein A2Y23_08570 [Clostridiales bacterium GWB2_37_7]
MNLDLIKQRAFENLSKRKAHKHRETGFIYYHGARVANLVINLRKLIIPEDDTMDEILQAAAYFHDVAKGIEPHHKYGAIIVREMLKDLCTEKEVEQISQLIQCHALRKKRKYNNYEMLLQDADLLDHFGTIELWMNFYYYATENQNMEFSIDFYNTEFKALAMKNRSFLNFEISEQIFDEKLEFVNSFVKRMEIENKGDIVDFSKKEVR